MSELMRESRIRHRKVKLQCGDESARGKLRGAPAPQNPCTASRFTGGVSSVGADAANVVMLENVPAAPVNCRNSKTSPRWADPQIASPLFLPPFDSESFVFLFEVHQL